MPYEMIFGQTVANLREGAAMTQQELADKVGVSRSHIAGIEGGRCIPSVVVLWNLSEALGDEPGDMLTHLMTGEW